MLGYLTGYVMLMLMNMALGVACFHGWNGKAQASAKVEQQAEEIEA